MILPSCLDLVFKQVLLPRPPLLIKSLAALWYSKKTALPQALAPPKRNKSAWIFYVSEKLKLKRLECPDLTKNEIFTKLSEDWRNSERATLEKYYQLAENDKKKYEQEILAYKASLTEADKLTIAKAKASSITDHKKLLKALGMPKKSPNAYVIFCSEYCKKNFESPQDSFKYASKLSTAWAGLSPTDKSKYVELAAKADKEYRIKLQKWEEEMTAQGHLEVIHTKKKA